MDKKKADAVGRACEAILRPGDWLVPPAGVTRQVRLFDCTHDHKYCAGAESRESS